MKFKPATSPSLSGPVKDRVGPNGKASSAGPFSRALKRGKKEEPDRVVEGAFSEAMQRTKRDEDQDDEDDQERPQTR